MWKNTAFSPFFFVSLGALAPKNTQGKKKEKRKKKDEEKLKESIDKILKKYRVEGLLECKYNKEVEKKETSLGRAWFDIPMKRVDERRFEATLPLCEVGHFEAKCFFLKEGESQPTWPP